MANHFEFLNLGDQWLISYASTISNMPIPTLFIIGHCLEAYCKAAILKHNPSINIYEKKYGHNIENMLLQIKAEIGIIQYIQFYPNVESRFMTGGPIPLTDALMSDPEYLHYVPNQELYWVAKFQKDIKYFGTSGKYMPTQYGVTVMERNIYWVQLLRDLRSYIVHAPEIQSPQMQIHLNHNNPPLYVREYLHLICS
jgi:hypothetical protein